MMKVIAYAGAVDELRWKMLDEAIMKNRSFSLRFVMTLGFLCAAAPAGGKPYTTEWETLAGHEEAPQWFRDAKFGIYFHWGVYSVPAYGQEWYPRWMHVEGYVRRGKHDYFKHHLETYGSE